MHPYWGKNFFGFFATLFIRFGQALQGRLSWHELATDEIQILVLFFVACSSALVGVFLTLRRMTMLANSLSHTVLLGLVITFLVMKQTEGVFGLKSFILASLITGFLTTFITEWFHKNLRLQEDASIGLVFNAFFALGIIGVSLFARHAHLGLETIMGNIDALHLQDVKLSATLFLFNFLLILVFYARYALIAFDIVLARNFGVSIHFFNYLLMMQTAATAIGAFRALGVFLFLAFLVVPVLTARFFVSHLKTLIICSCLIGGLTSLISVALSRHLLSVYQISLSTAGITTVILACFFLIGIGARSMVTFAKKRNRYFDEKKAHCLTRKHRFHRPKHP